MAITTVDVLLTPDAWTLVATNPNVLVIKPSSYLPWDVAITAGGAPAPDLQGIPMGRDQHNKVEAFEASAITGEVYVRIKTNPQAFAGGTFRIGVIKDEA